MQAPQLGIQTPVSTSARGLHPDCSSLWETNAPAAHLVRLGGSSPQEAHQSLCPSEAWPESSRVGFSLGLDPRRLSSPHGGPRG